MKVGFRIAPLVCAVAATTVASAEDLPIKPPPNAVVTSSGGFYVWADGPWRSIRTVGPETVPNALGVDAAPSGAKVDHQSPAPDGIRSGIGYVFPNGTFSPAWGSNVRTEFGAAQTHASVPVGPGSANGLVGAGPDGMIAGGCVGCAQPVASDYSRTQTSLKAASDYSIGGITVTPSISLFSAANQQTVPTIPGEAPASLEWSDWGTKIGVDGKFGLAQNLTLDVGGSIGLARREAGVTSATNTAPGETTAALANAQAQLTYKPATNFELKSYAGVNSFDSRAPTVVAPSAPGDAVGIRFSPEAGYYAGAGATLRFGTR